MKALSLRQPWLVTILTLDKRVENRKWPTKYRGPILLHASKSMKREEFFDVLHFVRRVCGEEAYRDFPIRPVVQLGGIVGRARIVDCVTSHESPWFFGPYGFVLEDVEPLPFVPCSGALGLWNVPPRVLEQLANVVGAR